MAKYNPNGRVGVDFMFITLLGFVAMVIIMLPFISEPKEKDNEAPPPQGSILVEVSWDDSLNADLDLWVKAPKDVAVGYSNKGGLVFNLLRDDLGHVNDISNRNMEIAFTRGRPDGEYIVNLHMFLARGNLPLKARVVVSGKESDSSPYVQYFYSDVVMLSDKQELTVVRFTVKNGEFLQASLNRLPAKIRPNIPSPTFGDRQ